MRSRISFIGGADADPPAELLQHIDAGPSVRRIHHEMHRSAVRFEHAAQSAEPRVGIREMMEHAGTHDLIEARLQFARPLDGKLADLEIVQVVFPLELLRTAHAGCAEVDAGHLSRRPAQGMLGRLRGPAAGNEDGVIFPVRSGGPEEMIVRAASLPVLPEPAIVVEAVDRPWIRITVVEGADLLRDAPASALRDSWSFTIPEVQ